MVYNSESEGDFAGPVQKDYIVITYPKEKDTICYITDFLRKCKKNVNYDNLDL